MSTTGWENRSFPSIFTDPRQRSRWHSKSRATLPGFALPSPVDPIPGCSHWGYPLPCRRLPADTSEDPLLHQLSRKDNSSRGCRGRLEVHLRLCSLRCRVVLSPSQFRNINLIPFRRRGRLNVGRSRATTPVSAPRVCAPSPTILTAFACALGSTNSHPNAVHGKPFSTSAFKDLV